MKLNLKHNRFVVPLIQLIQKKTKLRIEVAQEVYVTKNYNFMSQKNSPAGSYKFPMSPFGKDNDWNFKAWTLL